MTTGDEKSSEKTEGSAAGGGGWGWLDEPGFVARVARTTPDVLFVYDYPVHQYIYQNRSFGGALGYGPGELDERDPKARQGLVHPEDMPAALEGFTRVMKASDDEIVESEIRFRDKAGEWRWFHNRVSVFRRDAEGVPVQIIGLCHDVSALKRAEQERLSLERKIQHTARMESLGVLAGGIAHDFNNLLLGVLGYADLALLDSGRGLPVAEYLQSIKTAATRLSELTSQLLAYAGKGRLVIQPVSLSALVKEMVHLLRLSFPRKTELCFDLQPELPAIEADINQLRQVVMNLITNATEALPPGGGRVTVSTRVEKLAGGDFICLEVEDTGSGMSPEVQARIFEPFFSTKFTGRGLGLAAVQGIVGRHRGVIRIHSVPGEGSTFRVLLPCEPRLALAGEPATRVPQAPNGRGRTVLVIDDEELVRELAGRMLALASFSVVSAESGEVGLALLRERGSEIDCVLLDLTMPKMDGIETLAEIRRLHPELPVILCSGYSESYAVAQFKDERLAGFVQKPFDIQGLIEKVTAALGEGQS